MLSDLSHLQWLFVCHSSDTWALAIFVVFGPLCWVSMIQTNNLDSICAMVILVAGYIIISWEKSINVLLLELLC